MSDKIDQKYFYDYLGGLLTQLLFKVEREARTRGISLFLVGGVVRDILLKQMSRDLDLDFVIEGSAIDFAKDIQNLYDGELTIHPNFGTATWHIDETVAKKFSWRLDKLPNHLDFAMARRETYERPTALPSVSPSDIHNDLQRRDFTINALAIQLTPLSQNGQLLDYFNGMDDLDKGLIRVLHDKSFIDDPTRIFRAVRFAQRLNFEIESHTHSLIPDALLYLSQITGERIRHEIDLILEEDNPEKHLLTLQEMGALQAFHPDFSISQQLAKSFHNIRWNHPQWVANNMGVSRVTLYWCGIAWELEPDKIEAVCRRLLFNKEMTHILVDMGQLKQLKERLLQDLRPSQVVALLQPIQEIALLAFLQIMKNETLHQLIKKFWTRWRHIQPTITGNTLKELGLPPGPRYKIILDSLRIAWLDGNIQNPEDEQRYLKQLLEQES